MSLSVFSTDWEEGGGGQLPYCWWENEWMGVAYQTDKQQLGFFQGRERAGRAIKKRACSGGLAILIDKNPLPYEILQWKLGEVCILLDKQISTQVERNEELCRQVLNKQEAEPLEMNPNEITVCPEREFKIAALKMLTKVQRIMHEQRILI